MSENTSNIGILISADAEWKVVRSIYPTLRVAISPFGEWFEADIGSDDASHHKVIFFHGGWGKIAAAGSTQFVIDHFKPQLLINIGTCGSLDPKIKRGDILLADKTVVYDIVEQMGDPEAAIESYAVKLDNSWLHNAIPDTQRATLLSADRDIVQADIKVLRQKYDAVAADWESGAISWIAQRNHVPAVIMRGVSDIVSEDTAAAYGDLAHFEEGSHIIMTKLVSCLTGCIDTWLQRNGNKK